MVVPRARKLKSGNWFIQMRLGGESVPVTESTEKKCIATARLIKAEYLAGERAKRTLSGFTLKQAVNKYIDVRRNVLSPSSIRSYSMIRDHRFADIMDKPIKEIKDWQEVCNNEAKTCAPKTLKSSWMFIVSVLKEQADLTPPKVKLPQIVPKDKEFLEPEQIPLFIEAIKGEPCEAPALLALHGLRRSEIFIMSWNNIDTKNKIIKVRGAAVYDAENKLVQKKTNKTTSSRRDVPIIIPRLLELAKSSDPKETIAKTPTVIYRQINRICNDNGLPLVGIHGLRHSFASLCYHLGLSEMFTMRVGGWTDIMTMRKIYTHLANRDIEKSETALQNFFKDTNEDTTKEEKEKLKKSD